jgi:hypothetical protein
MDKRYQVFLSSTYADLKEERARVIQTLMEMDCIASGMELFPAADEDQWSFITKVIDDCDYYLLIIGGRYGSVTPEGVSYTEKEYDYAVAKGLKVIALLHGDPDSIPVGKSDLESTARARLEVFRKKVGSGRLVKFWNKAEDLPGLVSQSLSKTIKTYPAVGWVRGDSAGNERLLTELNEVRKENAALRQTIAELPRQEEVSIADLAGLDDAYDFTGTVFRNGQERTWRVTLKWKEVFALVAPYLQKTPSDETVKVIFDWALHDVSKSGGVGPSVDNQVFQTIRVQLSALKLISTKYLKSTAGPMALFWYMTPKGEALLFETRTVRKPSTT